MRGAGGQDALWDDIASTTHHPVLTKRNPADFAAVYGVRGHMNASTCRGRRKDQLEFIDE